MDTHIRVDRRFAIIDEWVLDLDISDRALRLYAILMRYADKDTHKAFPSRKTLARRLRCSAASVDRASMELIEAGLLSKAQRHNNSLVYTLHSSPVQTPIVTHDDTLSSPVQTAIVTGDDLTRTNEQEPLKQEPLNVERPKKEHRIPEDWKPSKELLALFTTKWPDLDPEGDTETFTLYWQSRTERRADWDKTFIVWMNKEQRQRSKFSRKTFQEQAWDKTLKAAEAFLADEDDVTKETNPNGDDRLWINFKNGDV